MQYFISSRLEKMQYNSALAIAGAIKGTSKEKLHQELGLESLKKEDGIKIFVIFIRSSSKQCPKFLLDIITVSS